MLVDRTTFPLENFKDSLGTLQYNAMCNIRDTLSKEDPNSTLECCAYDKDKNQSTFVLRAKGLNSEKLVEMMSHQNQLLKSSLPSFCWTQSKNDEDYIIQITGKSAPSTIKAKFNRSFGDMLEAQVPDPIQIREWNA